MWGPFRPEDGDTTATNRIPGTIPQSLRTPLLLFAYRGSKNMHADLIDALRIPVSPFQCTMHDLPRGAQATMPNPPEKRTNRNAKLEHAYAVH
jgi:hypothetical protein